jgi:hypothetical protein
MSILATNAGDVVIDTLLLAGPRGSFDMKDILIKGNVYESIFQKGTFATFQILDIDDAIGDMLLSGEESVIFQFHHIAPPEEEIQYANYFFSINKCSIVQGSQGLQKAKTYTIECVSPETLRARAGLIQKGWESPVSSIVGDIFGSELGSPKGLDNEQTKGIQKYNGSNIKPFSAIQQLQGRAVSASSSSSAYVFFENRDAWHFRTIPSLYEQGIIKTLRQTDTIGSGQNDNMNEHIIHFTIVSMLNVEARIKMGQVATQVSSFDQRTRDYTTKQFDPSSFFNTSGFKDIFAKAGRAVHFPLNMRHPTSQLPSENPGRVSSAADFMQLIVQLQVYGDTVFQCGKTIDCIIPKTVSLSGEVPTDPIVSGKFLISKLNHNFEPSHKNPRYTCVLEGIRGNFETGFGGGGE